MSASLSIRPCVADYIDAVSTLLSAVWHATYDKIYGAARVHDLTTRWHNGDVLRESLATADARFTVAVLGDAICGTAYATVAEARAAVKLHRLYVAVGCQGSGIGSRLLRDITTWAPPRAVMSLEVEPRNVQAIAFYEQAGFRVTGRGADCGGFGAGIEHSIMTRPTTT